MSKLFADRGGTAALEARGPIAQSRLERTPDKREVVGSIPTRPTRPIGAGNLE